VARLLFSLHMAPVNGPNQRRLFDVLLLKYDSRATIKATHRSTSSENISPVMIYSLEIENFYSILESQAIDLRAAENAPWGQHLVTLWPGATERAPRVIALFGANGSGKSTVLRALAFLAWFARDSFLAEPEGWLPYAPFADSAASNLPTRLALHFSGPQEPDRITEFAPRGCRYRYEVALHSEDGRAPRVISESLHYWPRDDGRQVRLFERRGDRDEIAAGKALDFSRYRLASEKILRPNASLISTLAQLQHRSCPAEWCTSALDAGWVSARNDG
jgi:hypothetical protein